MVSRNQSLHWIDALGAIGCGINGGAVALESAA
jgi:hypothetical protein